MDKETLTSLNLFIKIICLLCIAFMLLYAFNKMFIEAFLYLSGGMITNIISLKLTRELKKS